MMNLLCVLLPVLLSVFATVSSERGVSVSLITEEPLLTDCVEEGLELKFRFELSLCRRGRWWFDSCGESRSTRSSLQFDPVTGYYLVTLDIYGDRSSPVSIAVENFKDALRRAGESLSIPISELHPDIQINSVTSSELSDYYLRYRAVSFCSEDYNKTIDRIAKVLSLGMLHLPKYESGWKETSIVIE